MKKFQKSLFCINIAIFIYYVYSSFLSLIIVIDDFFNKLLGINTNLYSFILYSKKSSYSKKWRLNGLMERYYWYHWEFNAYRKLFYPVSIIIIVMSVIGLIINRRNKNQKYYSLIKIILILIFIITILLTVSDIYYCGWQEWYDEKGI